MLEMTPSSTIVIAIPHILKKLSDVPPSTNEPNLFDITNNYVTLLKI